MNSDCLPWKTLAATTGLGVLTDGWNLAKPPDNSASEDTRLFQTRIEFSQSFIAPPVVQVGLTGFDIDGATSGRISLKVDNITCEGFDVEVCTWRDTRVFSVEFSWLAIGP